MPWFEERSLFVGDTHIRWYEPGVGESRVDVDSDADGSLVPLEARGDGVVHGDRLVRQHDGSNHPQHHTAHEVAVAAEDRC
jgi:hypothetical protein